MKEEERAWQYEMWEMCTGTIALEIDGDRIVEEGENLDEEVVGEEKKKTGKEEEVQDTGKNKEETENVSMKDIMPPRLPIPLSLETMTQGGFQDIPNGRSQTIQRENRPVPKGGNVTRRVGGERERDSSVEEKMPPQENQLQKEVQRCLMCCYVNKLGQYPYEHHEQCNFWGRRGDNWKKWGEAHTSVEEYAEHIRHTTENWSEESRKEWIRMFSDLPNEEEKKEGKGENKDKKEEGENEDKKSERENRKDEKEGEGRSEGGEGESSTEQKREEGGYEGMPPLDKESNNDLRQKVGEDGDRVVLETHLIVTQKQLRDLYENTGTALKEAIPKTPQRNLKAENKVEKEKTILPPAEEKKEKEDESRKKEEGEKMKREPILLPETGLEQEPDLYDCSERSFHELKALSFAIVRALRKSRGEVEFKELKKNTMIAPFNISMGDIRKLEEGGGCKKQRKRLVTRWNWGNLMVRALSEFEIAQETLKDQESGIAQEKEYSQDSRCGKGKENGKTSKKEVGKEEKENWARGNEWIQNEWQEWKNHTGEKNWYHGNEWAQKRMERIYESSRRKRLETRR